jgi:hypothetical protein
MDKVHAILERDIEGIHGWCTVSKAKYMANLVAVHQLKKSVELGVWGGRSLLPIALASKTVAGAQDPVGIDPYAKSACLEGTNDPANNDWWAKVPYEDMYRYASRLLGPAGPYGLSVQLLRTTSQNAVSLFADNSIDLLHQDSNHSEEVSCAEVALWHNKVRPGGFWIQDDTDWQTTQKAQVVLEKEFGYVPFHNGGTWRVFQRVGDVPSP